MDNKGLTSNKLQQKHFQLSLFHKYVANNISKSWEVQMVEHIEKPAEGWGLVHLTIQGKKYKI